MKIVLFSLIFLGSSNTNESQGPGIEAVGPKGKVNMNWVEFLFYQKQHVQRCMIHCGKLNFLGDRGDGGEKGDYGIKGDTGEPGEKGSFGDLGYKGEKGLPGQPGPRVSKILKEWFFLNYIELFIKASATITSI